MLENQRDTYSNECITKATQSVSDAKKMLLGNKLHETITNNYIAIHHAMRGVLALDDIFPEDDYGVEKFFTQRYIDSGMMSDELAETLNKLTEYYDKMITEPEYKVQKPEAGYFTSKANFFVLETIDYIVQRNALLWGQ